MKNKEIAEIFSKIADILEFKGENVFKINAYRKASRVIKDLQHDVGLLYQEKKLANLPGIGSALVKKIEEYLTEGKIHKYEELKNDVPVDLLKLLDIQYLGPKTLALAHDRLSVNNLEDLKRVIEDGSLARLPNMGEKKVANIQKGLNYFLSSKGRILLGEAVPIVEEIIDYLADDTNIIKISPAGSVRRMKETVRDIDILVASNAPDKVIEKFVTMPDVENIIAKGETKAAIRYLNGIQVDLRVILPEEFGAALQYFTGSQAHNIKLRGLAKKKSLKINEYGIFKGEIKVGGETEEEIYLVLGLDWIPPEMREDRGEVELAAQHQLPKLINLNEIKGDLHIHTNYSDGSHTIEGMVQKSLTLGYQYVAICDHSRSANYADGLSIERLLKQIEEIGTLNKKIKNFKILKGTEADILADGSLDFPDEILQQLDIVVVSIHSGFKQNPTERILKAMDNPLVDIIAHPTGRLINRREGYQVDLNAIFKKAREKGIALEINSHPWRIDLSDIHARLAAEMGVLIAINTDAHSLNDLTFMKYGIGTAKRAWLQKENILNCLTYKEILNWKNKRVTGQR